MARVMTMWPWRQTEVFHQWQSRCSTWRPVVRWSQLTFCGYCKSVWRVLLAFLTGLLTQTYFPSSCYCDSSFLIDLFWFKTILGIPRLGSSPKKQETAVKSPPIIVKACVVLRLKCFAFSNKPTWEDKASLFSETVNNAAVFHEEAVFYLNPLLLSSCRKQRRAQKAGNLIF